jgi:pentatricopeptide repeat protein
MSTLNVDVANAVNPYLADVGVGLVFGLGYYFIKYLYGDQPKDDKNLKNQIETGLIDWQSFKTIEEINQKIKSIEYDIKLNPFEIIDNVTKNQLTPDINTYNNLLNSCYISGKFETADKLVEEMLDFAHIQPDLSTFNILLKGISCKIDCTTDASEKAKLLGLMDSIFKDIKKNSSLKVNLITINTSIDILIKAGEIKRAWALFDNMKEEFDLDPDKFSYSTIIKALKYDLDSSKLDRAFGILEYLKGKSSTAANDEIIFNCLIDVCLKLNLIEKAEKVFREMKELGVAPSKITYAIMIKGYGQVYDLQKAFELFEEMKANGCAPNEIIYGCLLNACVRCSNIQKVTEVYKEMKDNKIEMNIILYTTLIKAYSKVKNLALADDVYNQMLADEKVVPNIVIHNAMLDCCVECNDIQKMDEIYQQIKDKASEEDENSPTPDLITYSTVIKGFARAKNIDKVLDIYQFLNSDSRFLLDEVIYNSILDGCAKTRNLDKALIVYADMEKNQIKKSNVTYSILVKLYANNGKEEKALQILDEMIASGIKPGIIVYTCLIQTCLKSKKFERAINLFECLKKDGLRPDHVLFNTVVNGCLFNKKWDLACIYTLESFNYNVKMALDIYKTLLEKLTMNYVTIPQAQKCDFASKILNALKQKGISIEDETYDKVTRMIYKNQGGRVNSNYDTQSNNQSYFNNNGYQGGNRTDYNKDQLKWQRKNK